MKESNDKDNNDVAVSHSSLTSMVWRFGVRHRLQLLIYLVILIGIVCGPTVYAKFSTAHERYTFSVASANHIPAKPVAIVFGAGVLPGGVPTPYLRWRVDTAVKLYMSGRVSILLMSGDNSSAHYNEPAAMQKLAISEGVPARAIVIDDAGFSTYDTCYRAHAIFKVPAAILVSQGYHLPRALMTCNGLGVPSIGVAALHTGRDWTLGYIARELVSTDKSVFQLIFKPLPTVLGPALPISVSTHRS